MIHWDIEQGLSFGSASSMLKDSSGFLWIGTNAGLNRFDGHNFVNFYEGADKKHAIAGGSIFGLIEDSLHNIWIGTNNGLSRYDIKADSFSNFIPHDTSAIPNTFIIPFWATATEVFCVEKASMITAYNIRSLAKRIVVNHFQNDHGNDYLRYFFSILDTPNNVIWMLDTGGLLEVSISTGKQVFYPGHYADAPGMCYDSRRRMIWLNTTDGLLQFEPADKQFHFIDALYKKNYDVFAGISLDTGNRVWIGTVKKGILIYDPTQQTVTRAFEDSAQQHSVSQDNMCIYCDRQGITWTGNWSQKGFYQLNPFRPAATRYAADARNPNSLSHNGISSMVNGPGGNLWIGTDLGMDIFNPQTGDFRSLTQKNIPGINKRYMVPLMIDTVNQNVLVAAGEPYGLYKMNIPTLQCHTIIFIDSVGHTFSNGGYGFIQAVKPYKKSAIILVKDHGIFILDKDSLIAKQVLSIGRETITNMVVSDDGLLFMRLYGSPYNLTYTNLNGKWIQTPSLLDSLEWSSIFYNPADQTYWVGEVNKLVHYDRLLYVIHAYSDQEQLQGIGGNSILADRFGNIWLNTFKGDILKLNVSTGKIITLSGNDGIQKQRYAWDNPRVQDAWGDLYFAGNNGIDRISPGKLAENYPPSYVYIKSILVNNKNIPLQTGVNDIKELSLNYLENSINIETGIIDYFSNGASSIRYKIEGINANWQYAQGNYAIHFDGLAPGGYKLVLQASNAVNEFNGPEKILLVHISPPWWKTWWAYAFYSLCLLALIYFTDHIRRKVLIERERSKTRERELAQAKEIEKAYTELKTTQSQLIQSEKMASLGELTAGIAHEIQNPLNFVNNFSEVNIELIEELKTEALQGNKEEVIEIANDIKANEEKINHHGKRADAIVKGMLLHSRSSTGVKEPTDINALADEYFRLAYHGLRAKDSSVNATMHTSFDNSIGEINVIPQDIGRVLLNLYNNAFYAVSEKSAFAKAMADKYEPTVSLSTKKTDNKLFITVRDNGNGIPQKIADKIFQPFFTTKPTGQGTGLGLSLSYDIVKAHAGEIKVNTREGSFTEFVIQLPV